MSQQPQRGAGTPVVVLVCGGRKYDDRDYVFETLDRLQRELGPFSRLVHGDAPGADRLSDDWAKARGVDIGRHPAEWRRLGNAAGPIRNRAMFKAEKPTHVVAFPGHRGTADMMSVARAGGIEPIQIPERPHRDVQTVPADGGDDEPTNPFVRAAMGRYRG